MIRQFTYLTALTLFYGLAGRGLRASAQEAPPQGPASAPYTLQIRSRTVLLDVVVTDKHGMPVENLKREDFQIYEDKHLRPLQSFASSVAQPEPSASTSPIHSTGELDSIAPAAAVDILVIDEANASLETVESARYALKRYLNAQTETLNTPTMLVVTNLQHLTALSDYTTSKSAILRAFSAHFDHIVFHSQSDAQAEEQVNATLSALLELAEATIGHAGHKNVIWVGHGLPNIGMERLPVPDAARLEAAIRRCTNLLRDARMTLYTVDPSGISGTEPAQDQDGFSVEDPFGGNASMTALAKATGGQALYGHNDIEKLIRTTIKNGASFYTITYAPLSDVDDPREFRNIRILMKDPSLHAVTRTGYYLHTPATAPEDPSRPPASLLAELSAAGQNNLVYDGIPFTATRDTNAPSQFLLHTNFTSVAGRSYAGGQPLETELLVETFDNKGTLIHSDARTVKLPVRPDPTLTILTSIPTEPPATRVRFVLRSDSTGRIGTFDYTLSDRK